MIRMVFVTLSLTLAQPTWAQVQLKFKSKFDEFALLKSGQRFSLDGATVDSASFQDFLSTFNQELSDPCDNLPKQPDLTLTWSEGSKSIKRQIYIGARTVRAEQNCMLVTGEGIYYLPLHRSWFEQSSRGRIQLGKRVKIQFPDGSLIDVERTSAGWRSADPQMEVDLDMLDRFEQSLKDHQINRRFHPGIMADKTRFTLKSDGATYQFGKVAENLWAVKAPGVKWLTASDDWAFWLDMNRSSWVDRFAAQMRFVLDKGKGLEERVGALASLKDSWSGSIKRGLHQIVLDQGEKADLKYEAVKMLRLKPTDENFAVIIKALPQTEDREVLRIMMQTLRIKNPKGPLIESDDSEANRAAAVREWQKWWRENAPAK